MRADRILSILLLLQNQGKLTTRQLAQRLEVSERTIVRDMEALSAAGVPIYALRGNQGGWLLTDGYRTELTGMKAEEMMSLLIASHPTILADLGILQHYESAKQKVFAATPTAAKQAIAQMQRKLHIDGAGWHQVKESSPCLGMIQEAVMAERQLEIRYKRGADIAVRRVSPLGMVAKRTVWYLVALPAEHPELAAQPAGSANPAEPSDASPISTGANPAGRGGSASQAGAISQTASPASEAAGIHAPAQPRTYRISRIVEAVVLEQPAVCPEGFDLAQFWEQSTAAFKMSLPKYKAQVSMAAPLLPRLERERYLAIIASGEAKEGWLDAEIEFATLEHACEIILSHGPAMRAVAPRELRDAVIALHQAALAAYVSSADLQE